MGMLRVNCSKKKRKVSHFLFWYRLKRKVSHKIEQGTSICVENWYSTCFTLLVHQLYTVHTHLNYHVSQIPSHSMKRRECVPSC